MREVGAGGGGGGGIAYETYNSGLWLAIEATGDDGFAGINLYAQQNAVLQSDETVHIQGDSSTGWGIELVTPGASGGSQGILLASEGAINLDADEIHIAQNTHPNALFTLDANIISITATTALNPGWLYLTAEDAINMKANAADATLDMNASGIALSNVAAGSQLILLSAGGIWATVAPGQDFVLYNLPTVPTQPGAVYDAGGFLKRTP